MERFRTASQMSEKYFHQPVVVTYSGGKDSDCLLRIAELSGIKFEVVHSHTTVDAPQTVYHVRKVKKRMEEKGIHFEVRYPVYKGQKVSMFSLIPIRSYPPTRIARYCCTVCKETSVPNRLIATGVRWAESPARRTYRAVFETRGKTKADKGMFTLEHTQEVLREAQQLQTIFGTGDNEVDIYDCKLIETAKKNNDVIVNPIIDWTDDEVWDFCNEQGIEMNPLYFPPFSYKRVGCIGCPQGGYKQRLKQFEDFPAYKANYIKSFDRMIALRKDKGLDPIWSSGEECFEWWVQPPSGSKGRRKNEP